MTRVPLDDGFALNVERAGAGPPLALIHGFTGSAAGWGPLLELLAARFTVYAVDVVGHGASDKPRDPARYAIDRAARDVADALARLGAPRATWLGYSMGGRLALFVAAREAHAVERLALIGASPGIADADEREARRIADAALADRIEREGVPAFVDHWEALPLFASQTRLPAGTRRAIRRGRLANDAAGLANSLRGMGAGVQPPLHGELGGVRAPALLLAGAEDSKYVAIAAEMAAAMPSARAELVPGAGHVAHLENAAYCARIITAFHGEGTGA